MEIGTTYRLRTPKTGLGEGGGRGKRSSVDGYIIKLSRAAVKVNCNTVISHNKENIKGQSRVAELIEKYQENRNFAPKQNERDYPMT